MASRRGPRLVKTNALTRRGFLAATGGALAGLAAGCGGEFTQTAGAGVPKEYRGRTRLVFWHSFGGSLTDALQELVEAFHEAQDEIYVELQFQGSYEYTMQKLATAVVAKQIPDLVILSEVTWRKMHLADTLEPLNDYFGGELSPDVYIDQFIDEGTVKGTTWWVPFARSTPLFYYNKEILSKVGLPDGPATWSELREAAPAIMSTKTPQGLPKTHALGGTYASWYFQGNVWQWGGRYSNDLEVTLDREPVLAAGNWMVDFIRKDKAAYLSQTPDIDFGNGISACTMLSTGSLANTLELAKATGFELGTSFLPEEQAFGCPTGGSGIGIMREAPPERKEAAFELIRFLGLPENSAKWTMATGYLPVVKAAEKDPDLVKLTTEDPNFLTALNQLPKTEPQDLVRPLVSNAGEMMDQALQKLYSSDASVEDVFGRLNDQLQSRAELIQESYEEHYE